MTESDPTRFTFLSTCELLAHGAKLNRAERRRGLPVQSKSLAQVIESELKRRRMARMDRFAREAPNAPGINVVPPTESRTGLSRNGQRNERSYYL